MRPSQLPPEEFLQAVQDKNSKILLAEREYLEAFDAFEKRLVEFIETDEPIFEEFTKGILNTREKRARLNLLRADLRQRMGLPR